MDFKREKSPEFLQRGVPAERSSCREEFSREEGSRRSSCREEESTEFLLRRRGAQPEELSVNAESVERRTGRRTRAKDRVLLRSVERRRRYSCALLFVFRV